MEFHARNLKEKLKRKINNKVHSCLKKFISHYLKDNQRVDKKFKKAEQDAVGCQTDWKSWNTA